MTAKDVVLKVYPDAVAEEINANSSRNTVPTRWIIYSLANDRILTAHAKGTEEAAWNNSAQSILRQVSA